GGAGGGAAGSGLSDLNSGGVDVGYQGCAGPETARALGVDYLLTGTIQLIAESTRVTVQLVSAADNGSVWAEHYDLPHANLLTLEDAISEKVAGALKVPVTSAERAQLTHRYTSNAPAYESYLRGRAELLRYTQEGTLAA